MFKLEAINELLLTVPVLVKKTPLGFTKITCPLELICPAILDGVDPKLDLVRKSLMKAY